jgi:hypothetical protein
MAQSGDQLTIQAASERSARASSTHPSFLSRIAFRFAFIYLLLYCDFGLGIIPFIGTWLARPIDLGWRIVCPWVAVHGFHLSGPITQYHPTGSGDTTLDYIQVLCYTVLAMLVAVTWSILDRSERRTQILYPWVRLIVRFSLAAVLLFYGASKVYPLQFPAPDFTRLSETFGEASPMGLLWAFMGASPAYERFSGCAEVVPGLLLLFRRTSTAGALIAVAVMGNVVVLNFCYDVPVKLFSSHLLLMALFLLFPDVAPIWRFLVLRHISKLESVWIPRFERRALRIAALVLQILVIGGTLYNAISGNLETYRTIPRTAAQMAVVSGVWDLDTVTTSGSSQIPSPGGESEWHRLMVPPFGRVGVRTASANLLRFVSSQDDKKHVLQLKGWRNNHSAELFYQRPDNDHLVLTGTIDRRPVELRFHRFNPEQFLLTTRGFHWISEDPYNL